MVSNTYIVIGVVAILAVAYLAMNAASPTPAPAVPPALTAQRGVGDWTDVLDRPYDESVSLLRTKYQETFPIMVVREGGSESMPVEREIMYLWVDADSVVRKYSYDESDDPVIRHGGIVRRYDRI